MMYLQPYAIYLELRKKSREEQKQEQNLKEDAKR